MAITKQLGKNTLGGGGGMEVKMKTYNRSTHDLSFAWRSTMGVGVLTPCAKLLALPGDTYNMEIDTKVFTNPTIGPLFGQYKLQIDVFTCPIRLYIAQLHNNAIGIAMDMSNVKFPQLETKISSLDNPTKDNKFRGINPSSILAYLGKRGYINTAADNTEQFNAVPLIAYWDIFANYYCNKQEQNYYAVSSASGELDFQETEVWEGNNPTAGYSLRIKMEYNDFEKNNFIIQLGDGKTITGETLANTSNVAKSYSAGYAIYTLGGNITTLWTKTNRIRGIYIGNEVKNLTLKAWKIETLNEIREDLLKQGKAQKIYKIEDSATSKNPIEDAIQRTPQKIHNSASVMNGLALKTYQSDMFTNFINSERVNKVNSRTKVATTGGEFTIDALNLAQKMYNFDNRLAASNGTYKDYIEIAYTSKYGLRTETPIYEGGLSDTIVFEEVVNMANSDSNPLGEIGGRGKNAGNKKGGRLRINVDEPSYIIAIASITPYIDYSEGNDFDMRLDNIGQLHTPEFDGIGYEDLKLEQVAYWCNPNESYAKTTAWQNYMTNVNKVYGNFAIPGNMAHMCLNRYFDTGKYGDKDANVSTYVNPEAYNYTFAVKGLNAQNFQVQIGWGIHARRKMSARQIPNI